MGLEQRRRIGSDPQPDEVVNDTSDKFGPAAAGIKILDSQQEALSRSAPKRGAKCMAKVKPARRRGGESACDHRIVKIIPLDGESRIDDS
jgi:hypothetical protein